MMNLIIPAAILIALLLLVIAYMFYSKSFKSDFNLYWDPLDAISKAHRDAIFDRMREMPELRFKSHTDLNRLFDKSSENYIGPHYADLMQEVSQYPIKTD